MAEAGKRNRRAGTGKEERGREEEEGERERGGARATQVSKGRAAPACAPWASLTLRTVLLVSSARVMKGRRRVFPLTLPSQPEIAPFRRVQAALLPVPRRRRAHERRARHLPVDLPCASLSFALVLPSRPARSLHKATLPSVSVRDRKHREALGTPAAASDETAAARRSDS